ncbi:alpha-L-rhamnosidase [Clostridium facile]|uniref:alpha-L-rhamnosidase n=1 Tax=Clostridium facile TaxID=2763035 RepID=A0ABR7ITE5_9CLOT|nr:alpha-L-rhamnosidase [Clostridium facile]MBC5788408.1 family 78 glycoside hydrolase catalytic domain [Clostridium facile]
MKSKKMLAAVIAAAMATTVGLSSLPAFAQDSYTLIDDLTINYQVNPLGVDFQDAVRFSWNMDSNLIGQGQQSYQIKLYQDNTTGNPIWDSGVVSSSQSSGISYNGNQLKNETHYCWTVTVVDKQGKSITSEPAHFDTGCDFGDAKWIMPTSQENGAPMLRTEQKLTGKEVASAKLYISSLGIYTAYLNGQEVKAEQNGETVDDIFNPGWTDYKYYTNYQTYDVTDYISGDSLAMGVMLGKGWYAGNISSVGAYQDVIGDSGEGATNELALIAKLAITYADGSTQVINTNQNDWKSSDYSPVTANDYFDGESYDANIAKKVAGWNNVGYDTSNWSNVTEGNYVGKLHSSTKAVARVAEEYTQHPVSAFTYNDSETLTPEQAGNDFGAVTKHDVDISKDITLKAGDKLIVDMGQNMVGVTNLSISGPQGATMTLRHAEMLNDGRKNPTLESGGSDGPKDTLYMRAITNAKVTDTYTFSDDATQTFQPSFTYHGFRYVEITADQDITIHNIQGKVITAVGEQTGHLETSNADINQLVSNTLWSQKGNYLSIPTDCPQRGERAGWTGDAQLFAQTGVYNYDVLSFLENYNEVMQEHASQNGDAYGAIMPSSFVGFFATTVASGWSDAGVIIPWVLYQQTGDTTLIEEYYSQMDAYMDTVDKQGYNAGLFGDWLAFSGASTPYLNAVYQIYTTQLMSKMADAIGNSNAKQKYDMKYDTLKSSFMKKYVDEQGNVLSSTADGVTTSNHGYPVIDNAQTALLWALKCGLYDSTEQRDTMIANLIINIKNEDGSIREGYDENTLGVGFLGVNVILPVLTEIGAEDVAYDLLLQDSMPSWLYSVKNGATTIWERWNSYSVENSFGDSGMNSFNHYSYGACLEWMYEYMSGINADEDNPGFQSIILQPTVDESGRITYANGSYDSVYGNIVSNWTANDGTMSSYHAEIPANTSATLYLPVTEEMAKSINVEGITFIGMEENNGETVAAFTVEAGGYDFTIDGDKLNVSVADGYVTNNTEPTPSNPSEEPNSKPSSNSSQASPQTGDVALPIAGVAILAIAGGAAYVMKKMKK